MLREGSASRWSRAAALALLAALGSPARAETLEEQVNRAIDRGVVVVRTYVGPDGAGRTNYHKDYPEGDTALALYTLVKSGVSADDPQVKKCLEWLLAREVKSTYGAAVYILALDAFKDRAYDARIQAAAAWLEAGLAAESSSRRFSYPGLHTDLSNTQYGALGLWTAERHGFKAREDTWAALLAGVEELHNSDDGFGYRADSRTTGAMTVAGVTALELALARSPDGLLPARFADIRRDAKAAHERGWAYLERRFSVEGNPLAAHSMQEDWYYYYLYGIERLCAIAGREKIGAHDWYLEGARKLVTIQHEDGSWGGPVDTCFALLFLRRATFTTMNRAPRRIEGVGVEMPGPPPARPRGDVTFVRRWLLLGPLDDPDDEMMDKSFFEESRARPVHLAYSGSNRWEATRSLRDQVDLGGPGGPRAGTITCAFVYLHAAAETDVVLWIGHDNGCRAWLDGKVVHDRHFDAAYGPDSFAVRARLTTGPHRLLMKVQNYGGPHALWLRVALPDGSPATAVRTSLSPDDVEIEQAALANPTGVSLDDLLCLLPRETRPRLSFDAPEQLDRFAFDGVYGPYPLWSGEPSKRDSHNPNPGATGVVALHPESPERPSTMYVKVKLPERALSVRVRVSATTASSPGRADAVLRIGVFDGRTHWLTSQTVGPDAAPNAEAWRDVEADLAGFEGREVLVLLQAANGGKTNWHWEGIWIDEFEIRSGG
jgi:hypothetical protein